MDTATIQQLVPQLFAITRQLEAAAPGRHFTLDGHLIGSIGEVLAAAHYGLTLTTASTKGIDAHDACDSLAVTGVFLVWRKFGTSLSQHLVVPSQAPRRP